MHDLVTAQIFFDVLLPPIIFNAGFSIKKKLFFRVSHAAGANAELGIRRKLLAGI